MGPPHAPTGAPEVPRLGRLAVPSSAIQPRACGTCSEDPGLRADQSALVDAAVRHHCYELQIGFTHLGWSIWTWNQEHVTATAELLAEILERGPLPSTST
jgi:hypothetical protein